MGELQRDGAPETEQCAEQIHYSSEGAFENYRFARFATLCENAAESSDKL